MAKNVIAQIHPPLYFFISTPGDKIWIVGGTKPIPNLDFSELKEMKKKGDFSQLINSNWINEFTKHIKSNDTYLNTTEFVGLNQATEKGPTWPFRMSGHSMVKVNETTVYVIGGTHESNNNESTNLTWIADFSNGFKVKKGPRLLTERTGHCSAMMKIGGKTILVTVGGIQGDWYTSDRVDVELLDLSELPKPRWRKGKYYLQ